MKRICLLLLLAILPLASAFSYVDSYAFLKDNVPYNDLVRAVKVENDVKKAEDLFIELETGTPPGYSEEQAIVLQCKAATTLARYFVMEAEPKRIEDAQAILDNAYTKVATLKKNSFFRYTLEADVHSIRFLADMGDLGSGMASGSATQKAFKHFPDEVYSVFLKANVQIFAPAIGGGNTVEGCNKLTALYSAYGKELSRWDYASLLSCIGIACYKLKDYDNAKGYLTAAKALCPIDSQVDEYLAKKELQ